MARETGRVRYKAQVTDNDDGIELDDSEQVGNEADGKLLVRANRRNDARYKLVKAADNADSGYGEAKNEAELAELGDETVAITARASARRRGATTNRLRSSTAWSNGAPGPKVGSATSSAGSAGTGRCWHPT